MQKRWQKYIALENEARLRVFPIILTLYENVKNITTESGVIKNKRSKDEFKPKKLN